MMIGISLAGFLILILGSLGYMGVYALDKMIAEILMGAGIVAVVAAMTFICLTKDSGKRIAKEE